MKLQYESSYRPPTEFDHQFEIAWAQSLKRRFLWYCGVTIGITLPALLIIVVILALDASVRARLIFTLSVTTASLLLYICAMIYAWRLAPNRRMIVSLAFGLYVIASCLSLLGTRIQSAIGVSHAVTTPTATAPSTAPAGVGGSLRDGFRQGFEQASNPATIQPAVAFAWETPISLFTNHLFVCLFMPWSLRQSLRPALVIFCFATAIFLFDFATGRLGVWGIVSLVFVIVAFVPGSAWCWWRFSRFRDRFRLYYESSAYRKLQNELTNARRLHESQLPPMRTDGPVRLHYVYEPMRQIGGDLLFTHPPAGTESDKFTVVLLDVTGHGIAAALTVNRLVGELERTFAEHEDPTPGEVLEALNRHVFYTLARHSMFVTAVVVQTDLATDTLTYASGGHPTVFLRSATGGVQPLESTSYMLGVIDPKQYAAAPVRLPFLRGDSLLLYTDGAAEARNPETGEALGTGGIRTLFSDHCAGDPSVWPGAILARVASHRQTPPEDDTLIVTLARA